MDELFFLPKTAQSTALRYTNSTYAITSKLEFLAVVIREECIKSDAAFTECNFLKGGHQLQFCWQSRDFYHDALPHLHGSL